MADRLIEVSPAVFRDAGSAPQRDAERREALAMRHAQNAIRDLAAAADGAPCDRTRSYVLALAFDSLASMSGLTAEAVRCLHAAAVAESGAAFTVHAGTA